MESKRRIMAILIKLLATRIVAKSFLGLSSRRSTMPNFFAVDFFSLSSKSDEFKEKKATSAPEIRAEQARRTNNKIKLVIWVESKLSKNCKPGGSVSNLFSLVRN